jgi:hypothetical protein
VEAAISFTSRVEVFVSLLHHLVQAPEDLLLDPHLLEHGLDREIAILEIAVFARRRDEAHALVHLGLRETAL